MIHLTKNGPPETSVAHGCPDIGEVPILVSSSSPPEARKSAAVKSGGASLLVPSHNERTAGTDYASVGWSIPTYPPIYPPNSSPRPGSWTELESGCRHSSSQQSSSSFPASCTFHDDGTHRCHTATTAESTQNVSRPFMEYKSSLPSFQAVQQGEFSIRELRPLVYEPGLCAC